MARTFRIPCFDLPAPRPRAAIDFSIVEQIDGLLYALFGARLERDVLAPSDAEAVCDLRGLRPWECLAVDIGWYHGCRQQIEEVVAVAASHRACGVFVVPAREHAAAVQRATMFDYRSRKRKRTVIAWWEFLAKATRFTFTLPPDAFTPPASCPMTAVLADFGRGGFLVAKQKRMDEIRRGFLPLACQHQPCPRHRLGIVPLLYPCVSPLADVLCPAAATDIAPAASPFPPLPAHERRSFPPITSRWKADLFEHETAEYPDQRARTLALQVMRGTLDPFCGDRSKAVALPAVYHAEHYPAMRAKFDSEIERGHLWGPLPAPPWPNARPANVFPVPKHKYDEESEELRIVHNYSEGRSVGCRKHHASAG